MPKLTIHNVSLKNFLSYGNVETVVDLDQIGSTLIVGEDLDNTTSGVGANGVGKTTIINALVYGLYDKPLSSISKDNLVNYINKKNMEVIVNFTAPNGNQYRVRRTRKMKGEGSSSVYLYENGNDITLDSIARTNEKIEQILTMTYDLFVRIVVFSATHVPFLNLPATSASGVSQRAIIEELFGLTDLTAKADDLKSTIKDTEHHFNALKAKIDNMEQNKQRHNVQIANAQQRILQWEALTASDIEAIEEKLALLEASGDVSEQSQHFQQRAAMQTALASERSALSSLSATKRQIESKITKLTSDHERLLQSECPHCHQPYHNDDEIASTKEKIDQLTTQLTEIDQEICNAQQCVDQQTRAIAELTPLITITNINELLQLQSKQQHLVSKLEQLKAATNPHIDAYDELVATQLPEIDYTEINQVSTLIEHQKFLYKLLTKKDSFVRKHLLNKNIPYLNQQLHYYLTELGLVHRVQFTHELSADVSQFGTKIDFGNLSAGQQARVNIALALAFRDVSQSIHCHVNVCMLDEVLDHGLDSIGVNLTAKMLRIKAKQDKMCSFIITHKEIDYTAFDHILKIQLKQRFSSASFV